VDTAGSTHHAPALSMPTQEGDCRFPVVVQSSPRRRRPSSALVSERIRRFSVVASTALLLEGNQEDKDGVTAEGRDKDKKASPDSPKYAGTPPTLADAFSLGEEKQRRGADGREVDTAGSTHHAPALSMPTQEGDCRFPVVVQSSPRRRRPSSALVSERIRRFSVVASTASLLEGNQEDKEGITAARRNEDKEKEDTIGNRPASTLSEEK